MEAKAVGIKELKTHISKHLKDVKAGEEIVISERGKAIAKIIPIAKPKAERSRLYPALLKLSREGKIILPEAYRIPPRPLSRKKVKGSPFSDAVREGRR